MERESNPMEALCRSGCGFYGNPSTDGLCSVCFKEALKKKQQPPASTPSPVASSYAPAPTPLAAAAPTVPALPAAPAPAPAAPQGLPASLPAGLPAPQLTDKLEEESAAGTSGGAASDTDADDKDKDKKKKNRCGVCRKKVGLTGFECRCGGLFCAVHRYSDKHECSFDYRELGAREIRRNNPVVVSQKIHKI